MKTHRYPGVKPFTENEKHLFFGRKTDSDKLFKLISLEKLVLLYSKSGLGKSSLLNAGVLPLFDSQENTESIKIRLGAKTKDSFPPTKTALLKLPKFGKNKILKKLGAEDDSLWLRMKSLQSLSAKENKTYLLVFDQFEELFTYNKTEIEQFKKQLSDLLYTKIPAYLRKSISNRLKEDETFFSDSELEYLYRPLNVKVIFSIRSDRMSLLNTLTDLMPDILKNYYELGALNRKSAIQAIIEPAKDEADKYLSPAFTYSSESINEILDYLTAKGEKNIETFQLQTICQYAENLAIEKKASSATLQGFKTLEGLEIATQDLGNLKNVFRSHYDNLISKIGEPSKQLAARLLIEDKLIIDGNRVSLPDVVVQKEKNVDAELIAYLHDTHHIIRSEPNTTGGISYELSHDTLVAPILEAKKVREEKDEEERAEYERQEEIRKLKEKQKKDRRRLLLVFLALIFAVGLSAVAFLQMREAQKATANANTQTEIAKIQEGIASEKTVLAEKKTEELATQQKKLEKALETAKIAKNEAEQKRVEAEIAKTKANIEKAKAEKLAEALMPNEAKTDPFGYFWKNGKKNLAGFNYPQAYSDLLMAKNAKNIKPAMRDSAQIMYTKAEWYNRRYKVATGHFYKNDFAKAKEYFIEIHKKNPKDQLSLFYAKACDNFKTKDMLLVEGGEFMMGDSTSASKNEKPVHKVKLSSFYMSKYEVTNAQYARFLNEFSKKPENANLKDSVNRFIDIEGVYSNEMKCGIYEDNGIYKVLFGYENRPVAYVSWYGSNSFCRFYGLQLPSEAQWEYAAGGGAKTEVAERSRGAGNRSKYAGTNNTDELGDYAWYDDNSNSQTQVVGTKKPNELGLYDMSGNLWEWCGDKWHDNYVNAPIDGKIWIVDGSRVRVLRGGSWYDFYYSCRVAFRYGDFPDYWDYYFGFRFISPAH